jgi:hypothetical protein
MQPHTVADHREPTGAEVARWVLRNLAILMAAFLPARLLAGGLYACIGSGEDGCGAVILFIVPLVWLWLALPMLLLGGVPILLILAVAWRWPRLARALAVLYPLAFVIAFAEPGWYREHPLAVPVVALGILYYGFMLCLDPRQREAPWVWWVPAELAVLVAVVGMTGIV